MTIKIDRHIVHQMVNYNEQQLNKVFSALSDSTRRAMLLSLAEEELSVTELSKPFSITKSAITKHLKVLENAGLIGRTIEGRVHRCRLEPEPLAEVSKWITFYEKFWNKKLDALDVYLTKNTIDD